MARQALILPGCGVLLIPTGRKIDLSRRLTVIAELDLAMMVRRHDSALSVGSAWFPSVRGPRRRRRAPSLLRDLRAFVGENRGRHQRHLACPEQPHGIGSLGPPVRDFPPRRHEGTKVTKKRSRRVRFNIAQSDIDDSNHGPIGPPDRHCRVFPRWTDVIRSHQKSTKRANIFECL